MSTPTLQYMAQTYRLLVLWLERILGLALIIGIIASAISSVELMVSMDWHKSETFYELMNRVLVLIIGLELVRMLITHSLSAVVELLAFVIARKMLRPEEASLDILWSVVAFVLLMAARYWFPFGNERSRLERQHQLH